MSLSHRRAPAGAEEPTMSDKKSDPELAGLSLRERLDALTGRAAEATSATAATLKREAAMAAAEATLKGAWSAIRGVVADEAEAALRHSEAALSEAQRSDVERAERLRGAAVSARSEREQRQRAATEELARLKAARAQGGSPAASPTREAEAPAPPRPKKTL